MATPFDDEVTPFDDVDINAPPAYSQGQAAGAAPAEEAPPPRPVKEAPAPAPARPEKPASPAAGVYSPPRPEKRRSVPAPPSLAAPPLPPKGADVVVDVSDSRSRELDQRERDVQRREQAVAQREQAVAQREESVARSMPKRPPNWPPRPFPKQLVHQDMDEIKAGMPRKLVYWAYWHWLATVVLLLYNVACAIVLLVNNSDAIPNLILSIIEFFLWSALSFFIFRLLYNASRSLKPLRFFFFFAFFAFQILVHGFVALGIQYSGFCGILWAIMGKGSVGRIMCVVNAVLWVLSTVFCVYLWIHVRVLFSQAGGLRAAARNSANIAAENAAKHPDAVVAVGRAAV
eukprot:m51a1_g11908 putative secretory carrier-associated membrane protein 1-like (345) ;mRNA; f:631188-632592